eukprot:m.537087 g.537087  ORF g.537087 m.537087 type:complete len:109 (-) comp57623_c1_seq4:171-497(-)
MALCMILLVALLAAHTASAFTVTNSGASAYVIDGSNNPVLTVQRGLQYTFSISAPNHPFWIKTVATIGTGNAYAGTGVSRLRMTFSLHVSFCSFAVVLDRLRTYRPGT